jgi:UDP-glucose 4-epimerase
MAGVAGKGEPGPYNLAGPGTLTMSDVADVLGWYSVPVPRGAVTAAADVLTRLPLVPDEVSWLHSVRKPVLMKVDRARRLLGWRPRHRARETLRETVAAVRDDLAVR